MELALQKDKPRYTRQYYYRIQHRSKTNEYLTLLIVLIQSKKTKKHSFIYSTTNIHQSNQKNQL